MPAPSLIMKEEQLILYLELETDTPEYRQRRRRQT